MKTIREVLPKAIDFLQNQGINAPRLSAEHLLAHFLELARIDLYMHYDRPLVEEELEQYRAALRRRAKGEPIDYIMGSAPFFHCDIEITSSALIPRPETELLLEKVCRENQMGVALDLCTGTGCLAIGLKRHFPELEVWAADLSKEALALGQRNATRNQVEIHWGEGDLFAPFEGKKFDLLLCNPPYISEAEYEQLDPEVRDFEPKMALVSGKRGTEFFERLAVEMPRYLNDKAKFYFEIGASQGEDLLRLFSASHFSCLLLEEDLAGHPRFFSGVFLENE
jgi:release factor glutamine methyltransferase